MPSLDPGEKGREIFATWKPDLHGMSDSYFTDANAFELVERRVFMDDEADVFASSFNPVNSLICQPNYVHTRFFGVQNDRPQGGSVHNDGKIKLNIARRLITMDAGGLPASMELDLYDILTLRFELTPDGEMPLANDYAQRKRNLLATLSTRVTPVQPAANQAAYGAEKHALTDLLRSLGVL